VLVDSTRQFHRGLHTLVVGAVEVRFAFALVLAFASILAATICVLGVDM
jgi:hypothetical protein